MVIDEAIDANADDYQKFLVSWLQAAIILGIAWGIGGILNEESRKQFDQFHKKVSERLLFMCNLIVKLEILFNSKLKLFGKLLNSIEIFSIFMFVLDLDRP